MPGKVYARVLQKRLIVFAELELAEAQNGFRPRRGCVDAMFTVRRLMEMSREQQKNLCILFIDFVKAYDSVQRDSLWQVMLDWGAPARFVQKLADLREPTRVYVQLGTLFGADFRTAVGLRQGCVLAPVLFNLYLERVMRDANVRGGVKVDVVEGKALLRPNAYREKASHSVCVAEVRFADDLTVLGGDAATVQEDVGRVEKCALKYGLAMSMSKSKMMHILGDGMSGEGSIVVAGKEVDKVNKFVFLGSMVNEDGGCSDEIKRRMALARSSFDALKSVLWKQTDVTIPTKMRIFRAGVLSRLLYGAECWVITSADMDRLEAFQSSCLRRILRVSYMKHRSNEWVRMQCGQPLLEEIIRQRRMRWLGHVQRMDGERYPRCMLWGRLAAGKRRKGGQKLRWVDLCSADLKRKGVDATWKERCEERREWRRLFDPLSYCTVKEEKRAAKKESEATEGWIGCSRGGCTRVFRRPQDEKRHRCITTRPKGGRAAGARTTLASSASTSACLRSSRRP